MEEAALDGIPALVIDPKGDLANLLLTFPDLQPADFRPWIQMEEAARRGQSPDEFAAAQAALWSTGLREWGQDGNRIRARDAADFAIYTPGSSAGLPISILQSFAAPPAAILADQDLRRERTSTTVTSLLGLLGIQADPVQSREHILLSTILETSWSQRQNVDLAALIWLVQSPPVTRLGATSNFLASSTQSSTMRTAGTARASSRPGGAQGVQHNVVLWGAVMVMCAPGVRRRDPVPLAPHPAVH